MLRRLFPPAIVWFGVLALLAPRLLAGPLPKSTQEMFKKEKLDPSLLGDIDAELKLPEGWLEKAEKEGTVRVTSTYKDSEAEVLFAPFKERYPNIRLDYYYRSTQASRSTKTLIAFRSGRVLTDIVTGIGSNYHKFKELGALENLHGIPNLKNLPAVALDPGYLMAGKEASYWCMTYNTNLVKRENLPRAWDDLLTNPRWRNGNLGLANRSNQWALQLWKTKGEKWAREFLSKLFTEVKPQLRKEGLSAMPQLVAAGEFHAAIPSSQSHAAQIQAVGAPVGYHCPDVIPGTVGDTVILKGTPNLHAARVFVNWILSKEGQITQFVADDSAPIHRGLKRPEFIPMFEEIRDKPVIFRDSASELELGPPLVDLWNSYWFRRR